MCAMKNAINVMKNMVLQLDISKNHDFFSMYNKKKENALKTNKIQEDIILPTVRKDTKAYC